MRFVNSYSYLAHQPKQRALTWHIKSARSSGQRGQPHRHQLRSRSSRLVCCAGKQLQVVFVTTEVAPWSKSGGLADVLSGLPAALAARGHRVMTVSPRYGDYTDAIDSGARAPVHVGHSSSSQHQVRQGAPPTAVPEAPKDPLVKYFVSDVGDGVHYVFVDHPIFQQQHSHNVHNPHSIPTYSHGGEAADHQARNSVLCQAALAAPLLLWPEAGQANLNDKEQLEWAALTDALAYAELKATEASNNPQTAGTECGWVITNGVAASSRACQPKRGNNPWFRPPAPINTKPYTAQHSSVQAGYTDATRLPHQPGNHLPMPPWLFGTSSNNSSPGSSDVSDQIIFVANDWSTGLMPLYFKYPFHADADTGSTTEPRVDTQATSAAPAQPVPDQTGSGSTAARDAPTADQPTGAPQQQPAVASSNGTAAVSGQNGTGAVSSQNGTHGSHQAWGPAPEPVSGPHPTSDSTRQGQGAAVRQRSAPSPSPPPPSPQQQQGSKQGSPGSTPSRALDHRGRLRLRPGSKDRQLVLASGRGVRQGTPGGQDTKTTAAAAAAVTVSNVIRAGGVDDSIGDEAAQLLAGQSDRDVQQAAGSDAEQVAGGMAVQLNTTAATTTATTTTNRLSQAKATAPPPKAAKKSPAGNSATSKISAIQQQLDQERLQKAEAARQRDLAAVKAVQTRLSAFQRLVSRRLKNAKFVFTIHNLAYQGLFNADSFNVLGLPAKSALPTMLTQSPAQDQDTATTTATTTTTTTGTSTTQQPTATASTPPPTAAAAAADVSTVAPNATTTAASDAAVASAGTSKAAAAAAVVPGQAPARKPAAGVISWLQAALMTSDLVVTVSPEYAQEVMQQAEQLSAEGAGTAQGQADADNKAQPKPGSNTGSRIGQHTRRLYEAIQDKGLLGIMNGVDTVVWSPQSDTYLPKALRYDASNVHKQKAAAKAMLQSRLGLTVDPQAPLLAFIGRLDEQKGVDAMLAALPYLLGKPTANVVDMRTGRCASPPASKPAQLLSKLPVPTPPPPSPPRATAAAEGSAQQAAAGFEHVSSAGHELQVVMLGAGQEWYASCLSQLSTAWPGAAMGHPSFNEPLAHLLMAAADFLLVPSRYEPCGLVALCAVRYGTLPIVSPVGGLKQVVRPGEPKQSPTTAPGSSKVTSEPWTPLPTDLGLVLPHPVGFSSDQVAFRSSVQDIAMTIKQAMGLYGSQQFYTMREACMAQDVSWDKSAQSWEKVLMSLIDTYQSPPDVPAATGTDEDCECYLDPPQQDN